MATSTTVYQFRKPAGTDFIDEVLDLGDNWDKAEAGLLAGRVPVGVVLPYSGTTAPTAKWLLADGAAVSRATYATYFALVGTTYGAGDGSTTFNLPNLKGKIPVGQNALDAEFTNMGQTGGEKNHALTVNEMPQHSHLQGVDNSYNAAHGTGVPTSYAMNNTGANWSQGVSGPTGNTGSSLPHNNIQPYITMTYIIKVLD